MYDGTSYTARSLQRVKTLWHKEQLLRSTFRYLFYICREDVDIKRTLPSAGGGVRVREKKRRGPAGASCASGQKRAPRGGWTRVLCGTDAAALWTPSVIGGTSVTFHVNTADINRCEWRRSVNCRFWRFRRSPRENVTAEIPTLKRDCNYCSSLSPHALIMTVPESLLFIYLFILSVLLLWNFACIYNQTFSHPVIC